MHETKICSKCERELALNTDYFYKNDRYIGGFVTVCKECRGTKFTNKLNVRDGYKRCIKCEVDKPATDEFFHNQKRNDDGLKGTCKVCCQRYMKKYVKINKEHRKKYYENNKEATQAYRKQWDIENEEYKKEYDRQWKKANGEKLAKYHSNWRNKNKEHLKVYRNQYIIDNPHLATKYRQKRRVIKAGLPNTLTIGQWEKILDVFGNSCAYCGMSESKSKEVYGEQLHQEHFIALINGGEYTHNNIIPSCKSCNSSKGIKNYFTWYPNYEHYSQAREDLILSYLGYKENVQQLSILK